MRVAKGNLELGGVLGKRLCGDKGWTGEGTMGRWNILKTIRGAQKVCCWNIGDAKQLAITLNLSVIS